MKPVEKVEEVGPGPGQYAESDHVTRKGHKLDLLAAPQSHKSSFKATPHKLTLTGNPDAPPPNYYDLVRGGGAVSLY